MSGFGFEPAGEEAIADLGLALVEAVTPKARVASFQTSRLSDRVAGFAPARRSSRVVTFAASRLSDRVVHLQE